MVRLNIYDGQEKVRDVALESHVISLGRDPGNSVVLSDASVSRKHAQIEPTGNFFLIRDSGSTNGTFVNEMLVRTQILTHGDVIRIGKYLLRIDAGRAKDHESTRVRVEQLRLPAKAPAPSGRVEGDDSKAGENLESGAAVQFENEAPLADASRERLLRLYEIQGEIGYIDVLQTLLERSLDILLAELSAARGSILLCERAPGPGRQPFIPAAVRSLESPRHGGAPEDELVIPEELLIQATTRFHAVRSEATVDGGLERPCVACALRDRYSIRGVVYIDRPAMAPPFHDDDLKFLAAMAVQVAISLANAQLFAEVSAEREKVQAIFTSLTDGVIVVDRDFKVLEANAAATVLLGLEDRNPLGLSFFELLAGFHMNPEADVFREASFREGAVFQLGRRDRDAPSRFLLAGSALPYARGGSEPEGVVITLRNRSELDRMEELKSKFLGNVAHKLRSPLTVIQGSLPLLRAEPPDSVAGREIIDAVERNTSALCHLVEEFMEFAEMEVRSFQGETNPVPAALKPLVREALRALEPEARRKGMLVVERVREDLPPIPMRPGRVLRAFRQLLDNAIKFAEDGGQVVVEAETSGSYVRIDVIDDGPGIPREEIESVFYVCHQVDAERTGQVPGAGLGLTLARHIIQEHGGEIRITSPFRFPDHGARVSIFLPVGGPRSADAGGDGILDGASSSPSRGSARKERLA